MNLDLLDRIKTHRAVVGVLGLGYVGLPLALRFSESGFSVKGYDPDSSKRIAISEKRSYLHHIPSFRIGDALKSGFNVETDFSNVATLDVIIICVPTPLGDHNEPDLSYVTSAIDAIEPHLRSGQIICLESTTYPGTTEEEIVPRVESRGFEVGVDVYVVYSPEREDPGNKHFTTQTIPKVVGGHTRNCLEIGAALYGEVIDHIVPVSSTKTAEMTKLLENIHRSVNIGLVNELKIVADAMGVDIFEVVDAAASKPFGFTAFYPGPGLGGHCIPIDPFYLTWKAKEYGLNTKFIELAGEINTLMPAWVLGKVKDALNQKSRPLKSSKIYSK